MAARPDHEVAPWQRRRNTRGHRTYCILGARPATHQARLAARNQRRTTVTALGLLRLFVFIFSILHFISPNYCLTPSCIINFLFFISDLHALSPVVAQFTPLHCLHIAPQSLARTDALHIATLVIHNCLNFHFMRTRDSLVNLTQFTAVHTSPHSRVHSFSRNTRAKHNTCSALRH